MSGTDSTSARQNVTDFRADPAAPDRHGPRADSSSRADFQRLIDRLPIATYQERVGAGTYPGSETTRVSARIEEITGYPPDDPIWRTDFFWDGLVHPDDRERLLFQAIRSGDSGEAFVQEYRIVSRDGRVRWLYDVSEIVDIEPDGTHIWMGVVMDITDRKDMEIELASTVDRLRTTDAARRKLLRELVRTQEDERARIAEDLHDDVIQSLSAAVLRLGICLKWAGDGGSDLSDELERTSGSIQGVVDRMRRMMFELRPQILDAEGLEAAIAVLLRQFEVDSGATVRLSVEFDCEPDRDIGAVAFRMMRECITNVRKHGGASMVSVILTGGAGGVRLRIQDDGSGFEPPVPGTSPIGHIGLDSMRERAASAGGWFKISSTPGSGTKVDFWLPATV